MSILVGSNTKLVVQGMTGSQGSFHTEQMIEYGTNVVAGVTPGKGGEWGVGNVPIFDTVQEAVDATAGQYQHHLRAPRALRRMRSSRRRMRASASSSASLSTSRRWTWCACAPTWTGWARG